MHRRKRRAGQALAAVLTALVTAVALAGPAAADPAKPDPPPWTPPSESTPHATACTYKAGDYTHCLKTELWLNKAPGVDRKATMRIRLQSSADLAGVKVTVALPEMLAWERPLKDFDTTEHGASLTLDTRKHKPYTWTAQVRSLAEDGGVIRLEADTGRGTPFDAEPRTQPLYVGDTDKTSYLGYGEGPHRTSPEPQDEPVVRSSPGREQPAALPDGLPKPDPTDEGEAGTQQAEACVQGRWTYRADNVLHAAPNFRVEAWDEDNNDIDDLLARGMTDADGRFRLCFDNEGDGDGNGQDVMVRFFSDHESWSVENEDGDMWIWRTDITRDVADGSTLDVGWQSPTDPNQHRAIRVFDTVNNAAAWTPGRCWDEDDGDDCTHVDYEWPSGDPGAFYSTFGDTVHLPDARAENPFVIVHETGHAVMDDLYNDGYPDIEDSCEEHFIHLAEEPVCSFTEGWADWYSMEVNNDPSPTDFPDLENHTWGSQTFQQNWANGENVEGRVAGALWDLADTANEDYWDEHSENARGPIWDLMTAHTPETFAEFWDRRGDMGQDRGDDVRSTLYQNTIDKDFRNPLVSDFPETYRSPQPPGRHNYRATTQNRFWSAVAVRPPDAVDYDLRLFSDAAMNTQVEESRLGGDAIDFVAIDSNIDGQEPRSWYPRVEHFSGDGEYQIEFADEADLLVPGDQTRFMGENDVVEVFDMCTADRTRITVTPSDPGQDAQLFLLQSSGGDSLIGRSGALRQSTAGAAGQPESIDFTPSGLDCFGVVVINSTAQAGTYTINSSAP